MILNRAERMLARRYLLPGKGEGFIFLVAAISLIAVALGVAALIIVMSMMNGFRAELFDKIVGLNGHAMIQGASGGLPDWQQIADLRAYLYRAVLNEARSQHRSTQRRLRREIRFASVDATEAGPSTSVRVEVLEALRRLTIRQRAVVYLTYWCDLYVEEVADELQISLRTVARDLSLARKHLEVLLR